jgi:lipopolysaccharide/colanic/teichoic acid biosynthesis glycosyltransferase
MLVFREARSYGRVRRLAECLIAGAMFAAAVPVLIAAAIAIKLEDGGPIVFRQRRVGRFGRTFTMYKLRTMRHSECRDAVSPASGRDPRITATGHWLRKLSIDELPQLVNVLRGDMSIVGPRPEMPFIVKRYEKWQHLRHLVKPGITCIWQTECRSRIPLALPEATEYDISYINTLSAATDLRIIARTALAVLSTRGSY